MEYAKIPTLGMDAISEDTLLAFRRLIGVDPKGRSVRSAKLRGIRTLVEFGRPIPGIPGDCLAALLASGLTDPVSHDRIKSATDVVDSFSLAMPFDGARAAVVMLSSKQVVSYACQAAQGLSKHTRLEGVRFYPGNDFGRLVARLQRECLDGCLAKLLELSDDMDPEWVLARIDKALSSHQRIAAAMDARRLEDVVRSASTADSPRSERPRQVHRKSAL